MGNVIGVLKAAIRSISPEDQIIIEKSLPNSSHLLSPQELDFLLNERASYEKLRENTRKREFDLFSRLSCDELTMVSSKLDGILQFADQNNEEYLSAMMDFMLRGDSYVSTFNKFISDCSEGIDKIRSLSHLVFEYNPELESDHDLDELIKCAENLHDTTDREVKFSFFAKLFNKEMQILKNEARVNGREIRTKNEALSLVHLLKIRKERRILEEKWNNLISSRLGAISSSGFTKTPEEEVSFRLKGIIRTLKVREEIELFRNQLNDIGLIIMGSMYEELKFKSSSMFQDYESLYKELKIVIKEPLLVAFEEKRIREVELKFKESLAILEKYASKSDFTNKLFSAYKTGTIVEYNKLFSDLEVLNSKEELLEKFAEISNRLNDIAPNFSEKIKLRAIDGMILSVEDINKNWKVSYLNYELDIRNSIDPMVIQDSVIEAKNNLKRLDSILIQKLSVMNQVQRITAKQRQALRGFVVAQNKMTKNGRGVRDSALRKEAKNQMKECRGAVPVWIMPLSKVMDNFVIGEDAFDVLIIDEASQADITNLPIFSIAKKVIVVGDDKQVSPSAAGVSLAGVDELINEFLQGIPNKAIYDYRASLYDIACSSFGETIRLTEHFRCTPEIIQFCNDLQYQGGIRALRESNSNPTPPALVPFYVDGSMDESKKNYEEAIKIASLIAAMTKIKKYEKSTIGVISLFGNVQHQLIDSFLRSILTTVTYDKHKITCGKAPQFQGDERNIIFLSMVESPVSEGPLRLKSGTDAIKKEYNVAVSRAKDQLWILHSMNKDTQLQPDDIRLRLLKHASDPRDLMEKYSHITSLAESPFEESVHQDLLRENYSFQPQYQVGAYRIDIVLFTLEGKRIALECDGEKYHSIESQVRNDLERQAVLERLGFTFIRIRGSDYYRRKEDTVARLYKRLDALKALKGPEERPLYELNVEIDQGLLREAEKCRLEIESLFQEGEIEEVSDRSFNQRWGASKKKKDVKRPIADDKAETHCEIPSGGEVRGSDESDLIPGEGVKFRYSKFLSEGEPVKCFSCDFLFATFRKDAQSKLCFGYHSENPSCWVCKNCFKNLKQKNGWKT